MIENLRKYTGLMIVVFVLLFISFFFLDTSSVRNAHSSGQPVLKIAGRTYDQNEYVKLGESSMQLAYGLAGSGDFDLIRFVMSVSSKDANESDAAEKFFIGRMILRQAKDEFGVYPGDEEITAYLHNLRIFAGPDKKFNPDAYRNFEKNIGHLSLLDKDVRELISDVLAFKKINAIIGSGLQVDRAAIARNLALQNQQITGEFAKLDVAAFEGKIQPTDEEVKKYWDGILDFFTTEPRRKFTYIVVTPNLPAEVKTDDKPESIADAAATDEAKKEAARKKDEEKAKVAEERRKKQLETDAQVSNFLDKLIDQKGAGFEELAKENHWEVKTSEFFPKSAAPKELDLKLRSSSRGGVAVDPLFQMQETSDPLSKISEAIAVGENQWIIARLDGEEKSRPKTFDEAKVEARAKYISEKGAEAMKIAANEAVTKIKTLLSAGKTFAQAAKEAGITEEAKSFSAITRSYRPDPLSEPQNLFEAASKVDPGSIAEVITEPTRAFIVHVAKREVVKAADAATRIDSEVEQSTEQNETFAFSSWISARTEAAKVEQLYKQR